MHTWWRQVARAAGASLIAPLVLLLAAGALASAGGLGGLGSLGQLASGPSLPDTGLPSASSSSIERAEIVGAAPPAPSGPVRSAPPDAQLASAAPPPARSSPSVAEAAAPPAQTDFGSRTEPPSAGSPVMRTGEGSIVEDPTVTAPPSAVGGLEETTSGLGESLTEPLRPVTNQLLDLLRLLTMPRR